MKKFVRNLPLTVVFLLGVTQVHATLTIPSMLSFTEVVDSSFGPANVVSTSSSGQQSGGNTYSWTADAVTTYRAVTTPSTSIVQGSVNFYQDVNSNQYTQTEAYKYDSANYGVSVVAPSQSAGQYIELTGTVSTTTDTYLHFYLGATGTFSSTASVHFGSIAPTLPLLGFGTNGTNGITTSVTASTASGTFSEGGNTSIFLSAGSSYSFDAFVYSPSASVALTDFSLSIVGSTYNYSEFITHVANPPVTTLVGSVALPLAAVPEPQTYAMLLAGLALIGTIARRRKTK